MRVRRGPVVIVMHVVFARPGDFHRCADGFRYFDGFGDEIGHAAPSEAAAHELRMNPHFLGRQTGSLRGRALRQRLHLRGRPDIAGIGAHVGGAVHRLHGGVGQERRFVNRFHFLRSAGQTGGRIAGLARLRRRASARVRRRAC